MMIKSKKEDFLNSKAVQQRFVHFLSGNLDRAGCRIDHRVNDDANVLILHKAVASARHKDSVLIGDDTDLLVLLIHHAEMDSHRIFLESKPKQSSHENKLWFVEQSYSSSIQLLVVL